MFGLKLTMSASPAPQKTVDIRDLPLPKIESGYVELADKVHTISGGSGKGGGTGGTQSNVSNAASHGLGLTHNTNPNDSLIPSQLPN